MWELDHKESWAPKNWCFWTVVLEKTLESPLDNKEIKPVHPKGDQPWIFIGRTDVEAETPNTSSTWCKELTHWKRPWSWEMLKAGGEGDDRGWDGWMASPTWWTWVWAIFGRWWWTGRRGVLQSMGSQRVGHKWAELNCTDDTKTKVINRDRQSRRESPERDSHTCDCLISDKGAKTCNVEKIVSLISEVGKPGQLDVNEWN